MLYSLWHTWLPLYNVVFSLAHLATFIQCCILSGTPGYLYTIFALLQTTAAQMMLNIMRAFRTRIGSRAWLDQQTIMQAQNKVNLNSSIN